MLAASGTAAFAQDYPNRPVTLIIPWVAGGPTDIVIRAVADRRKASRQPIVIENKAGGGGSVGPAQMAATAKPDGYTISQMPDAVYRVQLQQKTTYDSQTDFTYIIQLTGYAYGVTVPADSPFKTWNDLVTYAKANPGKVNFRIAGRRQHTTYRHGADPEASRHQAGACAV
ncbi:MAG: tripartite tricarboxylate transporter substrate-binding protein [Xanthobacteraceae bacterium]